jgi:hypothetical protein
VPTTQNGPCRLALAAPAVDRDDVREAQNATIAVWLQFPSHRPALQQVRRLEVRDFAAHDGGAFAVTPVAIAKLDSGRPMGQHRYDIFQGRLEDCRPCPLQSQCLRPAAGREWTTGRDPRRT